jgi:C1A family cysteine protease
MSVRSFIRRVSLLSFSAGLLIGSPARADDPFASPTSLNISSTKIAIDRAFDFKGTVALRHEAPVVSAAVDAEIELPLPTSLVRILLEDSSGHEYLVYEAYPTLTGESRVEVKAKCEETCVLPEVAPALLKVQVVDAQLNLRSVSLSASRIPVERDELQTLARAAKQEQDASKVQSLNGNIPFHGLRWTAGETSISAMTYSEKKKLFGGAEFVPNLQGFEFYRDGIFDLADDTETFDSGTSSVVERASDSPDSWNWREAHGGDWVTPVKNQASCGSCWAFGAVAALETSINLYYNQHLNIDLSEQDMVSCAHLGGCSGALPSSALAYVKKNGLATGACFPYKGRQVACSNKCGDWKSGSWKVTEYGTPAKDDASLKQTIYRKGVIGFGISSWSHEMAAVGYKSDSHRGRTQWIIKNSWGANWGKQGYTTMTVNQGNRNWDVFVDHPFPVAEPDKYSIKCVDEGEGKCYWGISPTKPPTCPSTCKN